MPGLTFREREHDANTTRTDAFLRERTRTGILRSSQVEPTGWSFSTPRPPASNSDRVVEIALVAMSLDGEVVDRWRRFTGFVEPKRPVVNPGDATLEPGSDALDELASVVAW